MVFLWLQHACTVLFNITSLRSSHQDHCHIAGVYKYGCSQTSWTLLPPRVHNINDKGEYLTYTTETHRIKWWCNNDWHKTSVYYTKPSHSTLANSYNMCLRCLKIYLYIGVDSLGWILGHISVWHVELATTTGVYTAWGAW